MSCLSQTILFLSYYSFFSFYSSPDHLDLHSFPTRRSSDLLLITIFCSASRTVRSSRASHSLAATRTRATPSRARSEEHTSELQSRFDLVCRLLLEKKKKKKVKRM